MEQVFDRSSVGMLNDFEKFREFSNLYFCKTCSRSFDSAVHEERCKFCSSKIIELKRTIKESVFKRAMYTYFCPTCEKKFTTPEKFAVCTNCHTDYLHFYTWDMLSRSDKFYIKFQKALRNIFINKVRFSRLMQKMQQQNLQTRPGRRIFSFRLGRKKEELPSY